MNKEELREAIEIAKRIDIYEFNRTIKNLLTLAEKYLEASDELPEKFKERKELIIEEHFGGKIEYSCVGMRHADEIETYYLEKGDKVFIQRARNTKKNRKYSRRTNEPREM